MDKQTKLRIAYFRGMIDFWRQHLPPGWTIGGYNCDEFEAMVDKLESIQKEMERTIGRFHRAQAVFDEMLAHAERHSR